MTTQHAVVCESAAATRRRAGGGCVFLARRVGLPPSLADCGAFLHPEDAGRARCQSRDAQVVEASIHVGLTQRSGRHGHPPWVGELAVGHRLQVVPIGVQLRLRALAQLEELWPETVPAAVARQLAKLQPTPIERWIDKWAGEPRGGRISNILASFATMPGLMRRVRFLLEVILPSPAYMRQRYCRQHPGLWLTCTRSDWDCGICCLPVVPDFLQHHDSEGVLTLSSSRWVGSDPRPGGGDIEL